MIDYLQPDFYRFNLDSVTLVRRVQKQIKEAAAILDLGAGSGFLGIELARSFKPKNLTLLEAQEVYAEFLETNKNYYLTEETKTEIVLKTFGEWHPTEKYDLIVSNPPYFLPGKGEASTNVNRGIARTFLLDNWAILFQKIDEALSDEGRAYLVVRHEKKILETIYANKPKHFQMLEQVTGNIVFLDLTRLNKD